MKYIDKYYPYCLNIRKKKVQPPITKKKILMVFLIIACLSTGVLFFFYYLPLPKYDTYPIERQIDLDSYSNLSNYPEFYDGSDNNSYFLINGVSYSDIYAGIYISGVDNTTFIIQNCNLSSSLIHNYIDVDNLCSGINLYGLFSVQIINCTITDFQDYGIKLSRCKNVVISNSTFIRNVVAIEGCRNVTIVNSKFSESSWGISCSSSYNITIQECYFFDFDNYGITIYHSDGINTFYNSFENIKEEDINTNNVLNWNNVEADGEDLGGISGYSVFYVIGSSSIAFMFIMRRRKTYFFIEHFFKN